MAVARRSKVGVDIEQIRPMADLLEVADSVFSERERSLFRSLKESDRLPAFFSVWAQKEAYLKALGLGLNRPPEDVDVGLLPVEEAGLICDRWDPSAAECWSLTAWSPTQSYAAALAIEGHDWHINRMGEECLPA
jgi:4'-phosphopantetheinyl transferase